MCGQTHGKHPTLYWQHTCIRTCVYTTRTHVHIQQPAGTLGRVGIKVQGLNEGQHNAVKVHVVQAMDQDLEAWKGSRNSKVLAPPRDSGAAACREMRGATLKACSMTAASLTARQRSHHSETAEGVQGMEVHGSCKLKRNGICLHSSLQILCASPGRNSGIQLLVNSRRVCGAHTLLSGCPASHHGLDETSA